VETELNQWRSGEERFSKLFSFSLSSNKALLKEKLQYYDRIAAKHKGTQDLDERFALRMLQQERSKIEKQLYPNPVIRLLRRLLVAPVKEQIVIRKDNKKTEQNKTVSRCTNRCSMLALLILPQKLMSKLNRDRANFPFRFPTILMRKKDWTMSWHS
jgi:hypothetical protein